MDLTTQGIAEFIAIWAREFNEILGLLPFGEKTSLAQHGIQGAMSRRGNPYDNPMMESFMKTLKYEEIYPREYTTVEDVVRHLPHFIEERYNRQRLHSSLGYRPPEEFEMLHTSPAA